MRMILYTGKGGVGKTSIAAATACKIAKEGKKVLVVSTDQAHSLRDAFDRTLGNEAVEVAQNLYAMEIDAVLENEQLWGNIKGYIEKLLLLKGEKNIETEELLVFPGFEDLLSLIKLKQIHNENLYDVIIVDCAPTGETMSLLKFPEMFKWWMEKVFPIKKKGAKFAKPIVEATLKIPVPDTKTFDEVEQLHHQLEELQELLLDKSKVSIRIVTTPENIVISEAKRSFCYLHLFEYNVDGIIINKIFSEEGAKGYFEKWMEIQKNTIEEIYHSFQPVPIFKAELMQGEVRGYEALSHFGEKIFEGTSPAEILFEDQIFQLEKSEGDRYKLSIYMPFVDKKELNIYQKGDELSISVKNEKRNITLPKKLHSKEVEKASYEEGKLIIEFA